MGNQVLCVPPLLPAAEENAGAKLFALAMAAATLEPPNFQNIKKLVNSSKGVKSAAVQSFPVQCDAYRPRRSPVETAENKGVLND